MADPPVAGVVRSVIPVENAFVVVLAYAVGMALFTVVMGNAFAAFPVMTAGVALPLLVLVAVAPAHAQATHLALIVGLAGEPEHAELFNRWASTLMDAATSPLSP